MNYGQMPDNPSIAYAVESKPRRLSFVWILPFIAMIIGGWLIYSNFIEKDIIVKVHFDSGAGLVAGKTQVKYKGVILGQVNKFRLDDNLKGVIATITINRNAERALKENTLFWMVEPRISLEGISGLETLVSGAYIEMRPGHGKAQFEFQALSSPPPLPTSEPGLHLILTSDTLGSIRPGTPILYRKVTVGSVQSYGFNPSKTRVNINVHIKPQFASLVTPCSRFWNSSGISLEGDLAGLTVHAESMLSIIAGGISFHSPSEEDIKPMGQCKSGDVFELYPDYQSANAGIPVHISFETANGLTPNKTKVFYKGVEVGILKKIDIKRDLSGVVGEFLFVPRSDPALNETTRFWTIKPRMTFTEISGLDTLFFGVYLEMDFEISDKSKREFTVLKEPPLVTSQDTGLTLILKSPTLGSITRGTPVYFRKIKVGSVLSHRLADDNESILIDVNIADDYAGLVRTNTRFWNSSGITVKGDINGLDVRAESLEALLSGGISFETPEEKGSKVKNSHEFTLFKDYDEAAEIGQNGLALTLKSRSLGSITRGTPVYFKKIKVGSVLAYRLSPDNEFILIDVNIADTYTDLVRTNSKFWNSSGITVKGGISGLMVHAESLESLISGGLSFETPENKGAPVASGQEFTLFNDYDEAAEIGTAVTVTFDRAQGLKEGAPVRFRDVDVGVVRSVLPADDFQSVNVKVLLKTESEKLARKGTAFWIVRPKLGIMETSNLETLVTGNYLAVKPGDGEPANTFTGLSLAPQDDMAKGCLAITLTAPRLGFIKPGISIYYKDVPVGKIVDSQLSDSAENVLIHGIIDPPYAHLVHTGSKFWIASGMNFDFGLFKGAKLQMDNLETLIEGGIAFATPEPPDTGPVAESGQTFTLHTTADEDWLSWSPALATESKP